MEKFNELGLSDDMLKCISALKFKEPTGVQAKSIPLALEGRDLLCESATGSGKTFAFGSSIIERINPNGKKIQALILTPTRELTEQVKNAIASFSYKNLNIMSVYGGVSINPQIKDLESADIVVATPGRLLDHMERGTIDLSSIEFFVLDEADRMFDMGFIDDVRRIISGCPKERQTLFFSATLAPDVKDLARDYMIDPVEVAGEKMVDKNKLEQVYYDMPSNMKISLLVHLLQNETSDRVMVFCNTRRTVDMLSKNLNKNNCNSVSVHGGLSQNRRSKSVEDFNNDKYHVLVCTDVAARGLHIENVSHVYNYDTTKEAKEYVHRIGRTARAGKSGKVINLLSNSDHENFGRVLYEYPDYKITKLEIPEGIEKVHVTISKPNRRFGNNNNRNRSNNQGYRSNGRINRDGNRSNNNFNRNNSRNSNNNGNQRGNSFNRNNSRGGSSRSSNDQPASNRRKSWNQN